jgi:hypothetical protein
MSHVIEFINRTAKDHHDRAYQIKVSENTKIMYDRIKGLKRFEFQFELDRQSNSVAFACFNLKRQKDLVAYYTNANDKRIVSIIDTLIMNAYKELINEGELC